jgi:hypothetical protein
VSKACSRFTNLPHCRAAFDKADEQSIGPCFSYRRVNPQVSLIPTSSLKSLAANLAASSRRVANLAMPATIDFLEKLDSEVAEISVIVSAAVGPDGRHKPCFVVERADLDTMAPWGSRLCGFWLHLCVSFFGVLGWLRKADHRDPLANDSRVGPGDILCFI